MQKEEEEEEEEGTVGPPSIPGSVLAAFTPGSPQQPPSCLISAAAAVQLELEGRGRQSLPIDSTPEDWGGAFLLSPPPPLHFSTFLFKPRSPRWARATGSLALRLVGSRWQPGPAASPRGADARRTRGGLAEPGGPQAGSVSPPHLPKQHALVLMLGDPAVPKRCGLGWETAGAPSPPQNHP